MKAKLLRRFAQVWGIGFLVLLVISVGRHVFILAPSVEQGLADVRAWFDPSVPQTYLFPLIVASPALGALYLSLRLGRPRTTK
ncbi:MAG: hypothetical protein JSW51_13470 [Gemmatimonadota bacterium]|nr:MAG: hypothetical protein JSW51_13470 [Gemmatimonadota bacterium]